MDFIAKFIPAYDQQSKDHVQKNGSSMWIVPSYSMQEELE